MSQVPLQGFQRASQCPAQWLPTSPCGFLRGRAQGLAPPLHTLQLLLLGRGQGIEGGKSAPTQTCKRGGIARGRSSPLRWTPGPCLLAGTIRPSSPTLRARRRRPFHTPVFPDPRLRALGVMCRMGNVLMMWVLVMYGKLTILADWTTLLWLIDRVDTLRHGTVCYNTVHFVAGLTATPLARRGLGTKLKLAHLSFPLLVGQQVHTHWLSKHFIYSAFPATGQTQVQF